MAFLNLRLWKQESPYDPDHPEVFAAHGAPSAAILHPALVDALRTLIVPGLKELRMNVEPVERWLDAGAETSRPPLEFIA